MLPKSPVSYSEKAHGFYWLFTSKKLHGEEKPGKNDQDQGRHSFEESLKRPRFFYKEHS